MDKTINGSATGDHMSWLVNISTPLCFRNIDHELNFTKHIVKKPMFFYTACDAFGMLGIPHCAGVRNRLRGGVYT